MHGTENWNVYREMHKDGEINMHGTENWNVYREMHMDGEICFVAQGHLELSESWGEERWKDLFET